MKSQKSLLSLMTLLATRVHPARSSASAGPISGYLKA